MKLNNVIKVFLGCIATIFLGAIGSGFWEKVLSPLLSYLSNLITSTLSSLSKGYSDSIYIRASNLYEPSSTASIGMIMMFIIVNVLLLYALNSKSDNKYINKLNLLVKHVFSGWNAIIAASSLFIVLIFVMTSQAASEEVQTYSARQMEIVRPYIGEEKYLRLRSDYLRMRSKEDFNNFLQKLNDSAKAASINIEKFAPLPTWKLGHLFPRK